MSLFDVIIVGVVIVGLLFALRYTKNNGCDSCEGCTKQCKKVDIYKEYKKDQKDQK
ncbi:MAG: hypothetical protein RR945_08410 [Erysipelotrichaceae bacterium]